MKNLCICFLSRQVTRRFAKAFWTQEKPSKKKNVKNCYSQEPINSHNEPDVIQRQSNSLQNNDGGN